MKQLNVYKKDFALHRLMYRTAESTENCEQDIQTAKDTGEVPLHYPTIQKSRKLHQQLVVGYAGRIADHKSYYVEHNN